MAPKQTAAPAAGRAPAAVRRPPAEAARQPPSSAIASPSTTIALTRSPNANTVEGRDAALEADDRRDHGEVALLKGAEEEQEPADLQHACGEGIAERPELVAAGDAIERQAERDGAQAVADQDQQRGHVRVDAAAERDEPVVGHRPGDGRDQAEGDRHAAATVSAWSPIPMRRCSRASSSATRPCSR